MQYSPIEITMKNSEELDADGGARRGLDAASATGTNRWGLGFRLDVKKISVVLFSFFCLFLISFFFFVFFESHAFF
jgi:hypothetical protein